MKSILRVLSIVVLACGLSTAFAQKVPNLAQNYGEDLKVEYFSESITLLPLAKTNGEMVVSIEAEFTDKLLDGVSRNKVVVDGCLKKSGDLNIVEVSTKTNRSFVWSAAGSKVYDVMAQDVCAIFLVKFKTELNKLKGQPEATGPLQKS